MQNTHLLNIIHLINNLLTNNMKKLILFLAMGICSLIANAQFESAPAFPGAEGHGRYVTGGRGGRIIHVTNLNDSGTGSFRAAVTGDDKKIVVFDVSGYIDLKSQLNIGKNTTVLGQTAPGDGITLRYYTLYFGKASNSIVRYIRCRRSQLKDVNDGADATWGRNQNDIIIDHCSFSWSIDEIASFYDNKNFTMQWCTLGEALANPGHSKGAHSYGGIWGGKNASFHHNFLCHMQNRTPRFNGARYEWDGYDKTKYSTTVDAERVDFRNCVVYNWGTGGCYGGPGGGYINMVNNYYKAGPATSHKTQLTIASIANSTSSADNSNLWGLFSRYYISGNYMSAGGANYDWKGVTYDSGTTTIGGEPYMPDPNHHYGNKITYKTYNGKDYVSLKLTEPIDAGHVTTHSAQTAFDKLLLYAGASYRRDAVDERYMKEAKNGTTTHKGSVVLRAGIIDFVNALGENDATKASFPTLATDTRPASFDTDNDGIPDTWEKENGLNPNDASDALTYTLDSKKYYTNIEVYANSIVEGYVKAERADAETSFEEYYPAIKSKIEMPGGEGGEEGGNEDQPGETVTETYFKMVPSVEETPTAANGEKFEGNTFATVTGGSVYYQNNNTTAYKAVQSSKFYIGTGSCFFCITLDKPLKTGDVITFTNMPATSNGENGIYIGTTSSDKTHQTTTDVFGDVDYVVPADLDGVSTIYLNRVQAKGTYFSAVSISRQTSANAIENIYSMTVKDNAAYNLSGQRVSSNYRGIVIKNGKKYFNK